MAMSQDVDIPINEVTSTTIRVLHLIHHVALLLHVAISLTMHARIQKTYTNIYSPIKNIYVTLCVKVYIYVYLHFFRHDMVYICPLYVYLFVGARAATCHMGTLVCTSDGESCINSCSSRFKENCKNTLTQFSLKPCTVQYSLHSITISDGFKFAPTSTKTRGCIQGYGF